MNSVIYGPVPSWRLGRSLGIDLLCAPGKTCSFDCLYCQLGRTTNPTTERGEFVPLAKLGEELKGVRGIAADYVTFSGTGEPTLAGNLGQAIELTRTILPLPIAVLTNSSLMPREDVRNDLAKADVVVAKLDAHNQELFSQVNRPMAEFLLSDIIEGIKLFKNKFAGKLCLQVMFIEANRIFAHEIAQIASLLSPDEVQLNTPLRPCAVKPLTPSQMASIKADFASFICPVLTVYEAPKPEVKPLNLRETLRRRPKL
jgi:wyosine [tRNA(Phe)-imidazoG37] synthetase (radical SAM superfamily)